MRTRLWLGVGAFALVQAGATMPLTDRMPHAPSWLGPAAARAQSTATEGGEGGEGVQMPSSYVLPSAEPVAGYDAGPQIDSYVALVHATYAKAAADADALRGAIRALLDQPGPDTLAAARHAWINARVAYLQTETFRFYDGPIEEIEGRINAWPMNEAFVDYVEGAPDAGIVNDPALPIDRATILANDQVTDEADVTTGWHAIEFLLWGQDLSAFGPGNRPAADFVAGIGNNDRRRAYLAEVTDLLVEDLESLAQAWAPDAAAGYAAGLRAMDQREALGRIINGMAILAGFEMMAERLAVALDSGDQEDEHSCFSDNTHNDFIYNIRGIRNVWFGDFGEHDGAGLDALVASLDPALSARVTGLINRAEATIADLDQPFDRILAAAPDSAARAEAEAAIKALEHLTAGLVEVGRRLGVVVLVPGS